MSSVTVPEMPALMRSPSAGQRGLPQGARRRRSSSHAFPLAKSAIPSPATAQFNSQRPRRPPILQCHLPRVSPRPQKAAEDTIASHGDRPPAHSARAQRPRPRPARRSRSLSPLTPARSHGSPVVRPPLRVLADVVGRRNEQDQDEVCHPKSPPAGSSEPPCSLSLKRDISRAVSERCRTVD
jgi:hypothetical protein